MHTCTHTLLNNTKIHSGLWPHTVHQTHTHTHSLWLHLITNTISDVVQHLWQRAAVEVLSCCSWRLTLCSPPGPSSWRGSAASSAPWRWSACCVWVEWPVSWTTTSSTGQPCWSCWCVCSDWPPTGSPASGTEGSSPTVWCTLRSVATVNTGKVICYWLLITPLKKG